MGYIQTIQTKDGPTQIDYNALANLPTSDKTLTLPGSFADAKVVGDKFKEVKAETASLKEDLGELYDGKVAFPIVWEQGNIDASGNDEDNNYYVRSKMFEVADNTIYIGLSESHKVTAFIYDSNGVFERKTYDYNTEYSFDLVGKKVRFRARKEPISSVTPLTIGVVPFYKSLDKIKGLTEQSATNTERIIELGNGKYTNMFDVSKLSESGYILDVSNGKLTSNNYTEGYSVTDYIPCELYSKVSIAKTNGVNLVACCLYDANKNFIESIFSTAVGEYEFYIRNNKVKYLRYNVFPSSQIPYSNQYVIVERSAYIRDVLGYSIPNVYYVGSTRTGENGFTTLKSCTEYIQNNGIKHATVYIDAEIFDLVSEYGRTFLDSIDTTTNELIGLMIGNDTHYIFSEGAKVKFLYDGTNESCAEHFSAFNVYGSFTLENAVVEVQNARYCVHDDCQSKPENLTAKYINCEMEHKGNTFGTYTGTIAIGGGTIKNSRHIFEGGKYKCGEAFPYAISYHNSSSTGYGGGISDIILKNVYVNNGFRFADFGDCDVNVFITGCKAPNGRTNYATHFSYTEWGNVFN